MVSLKLAEAIDIANRPQPPESVSRNLALVCGFTPLHLEVYLKACMSLRFPGCRIKIETGLFGSVADNLARTAATDAREAAVVIEWQDIDPRLGWRHAGGWGERAVREIPGDFRQYLDRIFSELSAMARRAVVVLSPPSLPLPPLGHCSPSQASAIHLELQFQMDEFVRRAAALDGVRVVSRNELDQISPPGDRLDLKLELSAGFPYRIPHAAILAQTIVDLLFPVPPKKGLITDLDDVVWRGLVGEAGPDGVAWDLASHAQAHSIYQQTVAALADSGTLVAVASKNDPATVRKAFERTDLLLNDGHIFPFQVHWGAKSESISEILRAWNIGPESVVFVDDSPLEIAEVQSRHPEVQCFLFPPRDPEGVWRLSKQLRTLFGKPAVFEEDKIRAASLRSAASAPARIVGADTDFLAQTAATVAFDWRKDPRDARALELINKTNQFNLNGRRWTEAEWRQRLDAQDAFALVISYEDKFGPLGKISVVSGRVSGSTVSLDVWVLSCRAFSRRIEDHTLESIFSAYEADEILLDFVSTPRNQPVSEFLQRLAVDSSSLPVRITRNDFAAAKTALPHATRVIR
jgi:FkbH-like protein